MNRWVFRSAAVAVVAVTAGVGSTVARTAPPEPPPQLVDATVHPGTYRAAECRTVDGDTAQLRLTWTVDDVTLTTVRTVRVAGVDTPERGQPGFGPAKSFTDRFLGDGDGCPPGGVSDLSVTVAGAEKYGRDLASVARDGDDLAAGLLDAGLAVPYGGGPR